MATNFPTSLDSFTNPSSSSTLDSPSHAAQHANINDAMEAVQAKLGVGAGTIGEWTSYTPTFSGLTVGNGTVDFRYCRVNDIVFVIGNVTFGSTTSVSGNILYSAPTSMSTPVRGHSFLNNSGVAAYVGWTGHQNATTLYLGAISTGSTYAGSPLANATTPFSWGTGDGFDVSFFYREA